MHSGTSNLHSRTQHPAGGQLDTMYEKDKPKIGFRSSHFYRSKIRGLKCNGLMFSISVALVTFCIYYLVYWRGNDGGGLHEMEKGDEANQGISEDRNPKFDGLNRRVEVDHFDGRGDGGGFNDPQRGEDRMNVKNPVRQEQDRFHPQGKDEDELNNPPKRHDQIHIKQPVKEVQVPVDNNRLQQQQQQQQQRQQQQQQQQQQQGWGDGELHNPPKSRDQIRVKQPLKEQHVERNEHRLQPQREEHLSSNEQRYQPRGKSGGKLNDYSRNEQRSKDRKPVKGGQEHGNKHLFQKHDSFYRDEEEEDEIYDDKEIEDRGHRQVFNADDQRGNRHGNVYDYDSGLADRVDSPRKVVQHYKSNDKGPPKVLPIGPDHGLVFNQHGEFKDINPKDIAKKFPDVLGKQPNQKKNYPLQVPVEVDPDYRAVAEHNMNPKNKPKLPKFKPYKHINPQPQDFADMKPKPSPKNFPVTLLQRPALRLCPTKPFVLIVVLSQAHETEARKIIRKTWGTPEFFHAPHIGTVDLTWWVVFAIGSETTNTEMELENANNDDILQGDFLDIEAEETRKVMMTMKWLYDLKTSNPECRPAYVLKTGSHVFVNTPVLTSWLTHTFHQATNVYAGKVIRNDDPIRDPVDPHFVPYFDFKDEYFPTLVRGPTYLLSTDVVYQMVPLFESVTPIAMDDSYIGILASKLEIRPRNDNHFVHPKRPSNVCHYKGMMLIYGVSPSELRHIFNVIMGKTSRHCLDVGL